MDKKALINKANDIGLHFYTSFPVDKGIGIGSEFTIEGSNESEQWIVGRIDNVIVEDNKHILVEGRAIKKEWMK